MKSFTYKIDYTMNGEDYYDFPIYKTIPFEGDMLSRLKEIIEHTIHEPVRITKVVGIKTTETELFSGDEK